MSGNDGQARGTGCRKGGSDKEQGGCRGPRRDPKESPENSGGGGGCRRRERKGKGGASRG